jgi:hypothetical protein
MGDDDDGRLDEPESPGSIDSRVRREMPAIRSSPTRLRCAPSAAALLADSDCHRNPLATPGRGKGNRAGVEGKKKLGRECGKGNGKERVKPRRVVVVVVVGGSSTLDRGFVLACL